jgi:hypothetical protein
MGAGVAWEWVWDAGGEEKDDGVAGAEGNVGGVGPWGAMAQGQ